MPVSIWIGIEQSIRLIMARRPSSILDVGLGFGLWGFLCRFYLDAWNGRYKSKKWQTVIDGIEIFPDYISEHQKHLYNTIYEGDILELIKSASLRKYDAIILGDVLEHFPKVEGVNLLEKLYEMAGEFILIRIPIGEWPRGEWLDNPHEAHRGSWLIEDFAKYHPLVYEFSYKDRHYGVIVLDKDTSSLRHQIDYLHLKMERLYQRTLTGNLEAKDIDLLTEYAGKIAALQKQLKDEQFL